MAILEVKNIHKSFGSTKVLKGIDFELEKGDVLAIIGSSGSGKTTLLRCLNFLETPNKGTITVNGDCLIDGENNKTMKESEIRKNRLHFGLVFQQFNLFPQYTVMNNLLLAPKLALKDKKLSSSERKKAEKEIKENCVKLLSEVGLSEKSDSYPCELSGGQQQRVAIARALAMQPDILCFDEPTSALDPELTDEVLNVIRGLKSSDSTMIVVTHEMGFAKNVADKVMFMADGVIKEFGESKELFDNPKSPELKAFLSKSSEK